jgi:levansucrase
MPPRCTMPTVPQDFPDMSNGEVWVWDTWPLTDEDGNQYSVNGQEIIFSLVADRSLGFDDRHVFAKIGYFFRPAGIPADERPEKRRLDLRRPRLQGGRDRQDLRRPVVQSQTQWSGSARISKGGEIKLFFTDVAFYRDAAATTSSRTTRASR